eukprot:4812434-Amphidinium_carterae.1
MCDSRAQLLTLFPAIEVCSRRAVCKTSATDVLSRSMLAWETSKATVDHIACPGDPSFACLHHLARRPVGFSRGGYAVDGAGVVGVDGWCGAVWVPVAAAAAAAGQFCLAVAVWGLRTVDEGLEVSVGGVSADGLSRRGNRRGMKSTSASCSACIGCPRRS